MQSANITLNLLTTNIYRLSAEVGSEAVIEYRGSGRKRNTADARRP
jgi:hypothetical protein